MSIDMLEECDSKYAISVNKAWALSKSWKRASIIWRTLDHIFALGAFAASMFVTYMAAEYSNKENVIIIVSSFAALLTLMGFACNPIKYMTNYRIAFQVLNTALVENTDAKGNIKNGEKGRKAIIDAIIRGEKYIGRTYAVFQNYSIDECPDDKDGSIEYDVTNMDKPIDKKEMLT